ncbi:MAG: enoyl-CoA hydratase/isomerase family protein [Dehalococcoidia bacterium]|nr:enoyl-CoA hydratase/isomerase family protein [Dehalococcoidia bacterium]
MTSNFETLLYEKEGAIARVTLNRPEVINAYNIQMRDELYQVLQAVKDDPEVGAILLRGAGDKGFCAGADLTEFGTTPSQAVARQVRWDRDVWERFLDIQKPLVCALHGYVMGSGLEMALLCDLRIASEDAVFALPEVSLGLIPAAGGTQTLGRAIGLSTTLETLLLSRRIGANEALRIGLVHRVVQRANLDRDAAALAGELLKRDPAMVRGVKEALRRGAGVPLDQGLELEEQLGLQAWRERKPQPSASS